MEISLKRRRKDNKIVEVSYPIIEYSLLNCSPTAYLITHKWYADMDDNGKEKPSYKIDKIQFIAACKTEPIENIICAFYIGEYGVMKAQPIDYQALDKENVFHYDPEHETTLVDYKSYSDLCDLTGEKKLSFSDYILAMIGENVTSVNHNYEAFNFHSFIEVNSKLAFELVDGAGK